ncbi:hypothetical protein FUA48_10565 [Flavobacterium alkalisoli]|uniref:Uncharacterized protein n=1 Tax=Flavobacterium alkalisoli TaxID=2602769 RepID=A0A5B9FVB5_9FLAO|nr:hypothetical protein [Flavobacterium alkalisoli]QEE50006.1 hypothetical protein FUA48_10565 [Flavobacterium alkalisoli]
MKKLIYILLLLPFAAMAQEVPSVNGYKTFLDNKQVDITHYFIDPDNVADIRTDKNTKDIYITRKEQTELVCLADILNELEKNGTTAVIKVNDSLIEKPETYYLENNAISRVDIEKSSGVGHMNNPTIIHITTKNNRKE